MKHKLIKEYSIAWGLFLIIGFIFVLLYSTSTSFLMPDYDGSDSALYISFGKFWSEGLIPYTDYFDHKGPFIFWINMIGYKTSILLIQALFMSFSLLGFYITIGLFTTKKQWKYIGALFCLYFIAVSYENGNMSEEYCLPFITFSLYFLVKFFKQDFLDEHNPKYAFIYGLCCGICLLTRATNAASVCAGIITVLAVLIIKKRWKNIVLNAFWFLIGFITLMGPFTVYFIIKDSFSEYFYGMFLSNFIYFTKSVPWIADPSTSAETIRNFFIYYSPIFISILLLPLTWKKKPYFLFILLAEGIQFYVYLTGLNYYHYVITAIPQLTILIGELIDIKNKSLIKRFVIPIFLISTIIIGRMTAIAVVRTPYDNYLKYGSLKKEAYQDMVDMVDGSFITYGDTDIENVYIRSPRLKPYYRYVFLQDWMSSFNDDIANEIHDIFENGDVEYILTDNKTVMIQDILDERYELVLSNDPYKLYKIK